MTPTDRKILRVVAMVLAAAAIVAVFLVGGISADVALANSAVHQPLHSWTRDILCAVLCASFLPIALGFLAGIGVLLVRDDWSEYLLAMAVFFLFLMLVAALLAGGAVLYLHYAEIDLFHLRPIAWSRGPVYVFASLALGAIFLGGFILMVLRYVASVLRDVMRYSLVVSILVSGAMMVSCCLIYAGACEAVQSMGRSANGSGLTGIDPLATVLSAPSLVKRSPELDRALAVRVVSYHAVTNNDAAVVVLNQFLRSHPDSFVIGDKPPRQPGFRELALYYGDLALAVISFDASDSFNWRLSQVKYNSGDLFICLVVWSFRLLIMLLFAPVLVQGFIRLFQPETAPSE